MSRAGKTPPVSTARSQNLDELEALWARHSAEWRDTAQVSSFWKDAQETDPALLKYKVKGEFFEVLSRLKTSLIVSREYEHFTFMSGVEITAKVRFPTCRCRIHPVWLSIKKRSEYIGQHSKSQSVIGNAPNVRVFTQERRRLAGAFWKFFDGKAQLVFAGLYLYARSGAY